MFVPKSPKDFDYDLWTEDGKYFIRIKRTGEECEINQDTMRLLRNEEKKLRREIEAKEIPFSCEKVKDGDTSIKLITLKLLSLDYISGECDTESTFLADPTDHEEIIFTEMLEKQFCKILTKSQLSVYTYCMKNGTTYVEYSKYKGISEAAVRDTIKGIRKKAKIFFK